MKNVLENSWWGDASSGGLTVLRAPGKKQYAGPFQQYWKKDQLYCTLYGNIVWVKQYTLLLTECGVLDSHLKQYQVT